MVEEIINPKTVKPGDVTCYYHTDMDGIASASIVKKVYPNAKFIKVDYGYVPIQKDIEDKLVIIVDFSFDPNIMSYIKTNSSLLCWIDHHQSAMDKNLKMWNSLDIDGIRNIEKAGCQLTWDWFFPHEKTPMSIQLIADRDTWQFKLHGAKAFHEYVQIYFNKPDITLLKLDVVKCLTTGEILIDKKLKQVIQSFNEGSDGLFEGYKTRIINSNLNISDIGEYCYKDKGYPIAMIWSIRGAEVIVSLRSNTVDVEEIATKIIYRGGGHKFASGFKSTFEFITMLYQAKRK